MPLSNTNYYKYIKKDLKVYYAAKSEFDGDCFNTSGSNMIIIHFFMVNIAHYY